jgi:hypothetical protein
MTEIVVVERAEVVHQIVDLGVRGMDSDMGRKDPTKGVPIMSGGILAVTLYSGRDSGRLGDPLCTFRR